MKKSKNIISIILATFFIICFSNSAIAIKTVGGTYINNAYSTIPDGTYYIRNVELETGYIQIDNNKAPNYSDEKAHMELWDYDGGLYQQWNITCLDDGYYSIISPKSNKALTIQAGNENTDGKSIIQEKYSGNDRQKWSIVHTGNGMYKIKPKSSELYSKDWVLCAGSSILSTINGRNVEQRVYSADLDFHDEWYILSADFTFSQITLDNESDYNTKTFNGNIARFFNVNAKMPGATYSSIKKDKFISEMQDNQIFCAILHGGELERKLKLSDNDVIYLSDFKSISANSLIQSKMIVLGGCYTGAPGDNFINVLLDKGVDVVIGFSNKVEQNTLLFWIDSFMYYISKGYDIQNSINQANNTLIDKYSDTIYNEVLHFIINGIYYSKSDLSCIPISR